MTERFKAQEIEVYGTNGSFIRPEDHQREIDELLETIAGLGIKLSRGAKPCPCQAGCDPTSRGAA